MKASEEIGLLLKGVKREEIAALKEKEAAELKEAEEAAAKKAEELSSLETAKGLIEDLENKLQAKEDELAKLNQQFAELNNKQTVKDEPDSKYTGTDVFKELFNSKKEE